MERNVAAVGFRGRLSHHAGLSRQQDNVNGDPGVVVRIAGRVFMTLALELAPEGIRAIRTVLNPRMLDHLR
jgi:hypothetical protein